eukprot:3055383-Rhodomonas_salina.1
MSSSPPTRAGCTSSVCRREGSRWHTCCPWGRDITWSRCGYPLSRAHCTSSHPTARVPAPSRRRPWRTRRYNGKQTRRAPPARPPPCSRARRSPA